MPVSEVQLIIQTIPVQYLFYDIKETHMIYSATPNDSLHQYKDNDTINTKDKFIAWIAICFLIRLSSQGSRVCWHLSQPSLDSRQGAPRPFVFTITPRDNLKYCIPKPTQAWWEHGNSTQEEIKPRTCKQVDHCAVRTHVVKLKIPSRVDLN